MPLFSKRLSKVNYPFSILSQRFTGRELDVGTLGAVANCCHGQYSADGTKLLVMGLTSGIHDYTLSTPYDITTASYNGKYDPLIIYRHIHWRENGTSFFTVDDIGSSLCQLRRFDCSTAWQTSSGVSAGPVSSSFYSDINTVSGVFIDPTGKKVFMTDLTTDDITYYTLGTAWDPSTLSSQVSTFALSTYTGGPNYPYFKADGKRMFIQSTFDDGFLYFDLSTAWDITTASYVGTIDMTVSAPSATGSISTSSHGRWMLFSVRSPSQKVLMYEL